VIRSQVIDLKQQHTQEMLSCKSQFETDIKNALERRALPVEEPVQDFTIRQESYESEPGKECIVLPV
jgi:hypothetical protein